MIKYKKQINISEDDFSQILNTAEILVDRVACVLDGERIIQDRVFDVCNKNIKGKTEQNYNEYLKKRGVKL
ncbi:MAG: hypothetical protein ABFQ65_03455 [Nanoarchaeota archaeon]